MSKIVNKFKMLNFLSANNQKKILGISLTPGTGLEVVELDKNYSAITNYGRKKVEYNFSSREPQNYAALKSSLVEIMDEMKVQPKTPVYFVLPNVLFDFIEVPPVLTNEEIKTSILSETEKFYLFKKEEPYYGYSEVVNTSSDNQKRIAYTAFQKNVIEQIKEIIADIGLELVGIESSYSAILRGLRISGLCEDVISEIAPWHVMVVNTISFTLFQMALLTCISLCTWLCACRFFIYNPCIPLVLIANVSMSMRFITYKTSISFICHCNYAVREYNG